MALLVLQVVLQSMKPVVNNFYFCTFISQGRVGALEKELQEVSKHKHFSLEMCALQRFLFLYRSADHSQNKKEI